MIKQLAKNAQIGDGMYQFKDKSLLIDEKGAAAEMHDFKMF